MEIFSLLKIITFSFITPLGEVGTGRNMCVSLIIFDLTLKGLYGLLVCETLVNCVKTSSCASSTYIGRYLYRRFSAIVFYLPLHKF